MNQCYTHMSIEERETLSLGLALGHSLRAMATVLGRAPSTVSREHTRNARGQPYRACTAQTLAAARAHQPRRPRKLLDPWLWRYVSTRLAQRCSPEQIAGRLRREYPDDMRKRLSAETIYVALYVLPRGALRQDLLEGTDAESARHGFTRKLTHVPAPLRKTLTYDRGKEMAEHERLAHRLSIQVFFADPHSPWQRGTNENTHGLLRQYLPKGTDLSGYTQRELNAIAHQLNTRPRKCLHWATPLEVFTQLRHPSPVALGT